MFTLYAKSIEGTLYLVIFIENESWHVCGYTMRKKNI